MNAVNTCPSGRVGQTADGGAQHHQRRGAVRGTGGTRRLHSGDLRIANSLPDAAALARELQDFRVRFTESGNATFNARDGAHDDVVLALALAVFGLSRPEAVRELDVVWGRRR